VNALEQALDHSATLFARASRDDDGKLLTHDLRLLSGVPRSTVSRWVAELESTLATRLFHRTTRHVERGRGILFRSVGL
jgi:hypothetical protein